MTNLNGHTPHHIVIVGGGFGGLYAANKLGNKPVQVTLIDKRNFHLFQPLLYQVATGGLGPSEVAYPLRSALSKYRNVEVMQAEVVDIAPEQQQVILRDGQTVSYDSLVVATGTHHHYFGHDEWEDVAPGLKTIEDALEMRTRIFMAFEEAERETDPAQRRAWMTFVVVGGGPTGVELAGAIGELANNTLRNDFRHIDTSDAQILLLEGVDRILPPYPKELSQEAEKALVEIGVTVRTNTLVTHIEDTLITMKSNGYEEQIQAHTILWGAGMRASGLARVLHERFGTEVDRAGRVIVAPDISLPGHPNVFAIGDMANYQHGTDKPLPGVASVAMQQGEYIARLIVDRVQGRPPKPFKYWDRGSLAVIGRNSAVADIGPFHFGGYFAWLIWLFVHIAYLIGFDQRLIVLTRWSWSYITRNRGARLIAGKSSYERIEQYWQKAGRRRQQAPSFGNGRNGQTVDPTKTESTTAAEPAK